jgi:hypothetical protein
MTNAPRLARIASLSTFIAIMAMFIAIALPSLAQAAERGGLTAYADEPAPAPTTETPVTGEEGPIPSAAGKAMTAPGPSATRSTAADCWPARFPQAR